MCPTVIHQVDRQTEIMRQRKFTRPNTLRKAQVMPPFSVDLTLPPSVLEDIHVPADISGSDLRRGRPADTSVKPRT